MDVQVSVRSGNHRTSRPFQLMGGFVGQTKSQRRQWGLTSLWPPSRLPHGGTGQALMSAPNNGPHRILPHPQPQVILLLAPSLAHELPLQPHYRPFLILLRVTNVLLSHPQVCQLQRGAGSQQSTEKECRWPGLRAQLWSCELCNLYVALSLCPSTYSHSLECDFSSPSFKDRTVSPSFELGLAL